ncbi:MAG: hypothetical protein HUK25_00540 [Treponema sp.]|nr:hypothetical protein [Treponema sp.]
MENTEEKRPQKKISNYLFILTWLLICMLILFPAIKMVAITNVEAPAERTYSKNAVEGFSVCLTESENTGKVRKFYSLGEKHFFIQEKVILEATGEELIGREENIVEIPLGCGDISDCSITIDGEETLLASFFNSDTKLAVRISRISLFEYFMWKLKSSKNLLK